jgi:regulator of RNase E activity RraA
MTLAKETFERLGRVSTATLTTQLFKRGLRNAFIQGVRRVSASRTNLVGEAFTLRYIPAREDIDQIAVFENPEHPQRKAIETVPAGQVLVMDCRRETAAASSGDILITRLKLRGAAGMVTDGCVRDSESIAGIDFPVYAAGGSAPLNLACHHAVDLNVPIACGGVAVYPGDVMVGDADGVVVVPRHLADSVAQDAFEQHLLEEFVLAEIEKGRALPGTYPPNAETMARYRQWRSERERG